MNRILVLCLSALALAGCQSSPFSLTVAPRVTGRVLAADTHQPIADVKIRDLYAGDGANPTAPLKGGQQLQAPVPIRTDKEGMFTIDVQRVLAPFRSAGWFSLQLCFEHAGYERFITNYSYLNLGTNTVNGKPGLTTGNIFLRPAAK